MNATTLLSLIFFGLLLVRGDGAASGGGFSDLPTPSTTPNPPPTPPKGQCLKWTMSAMTKKSYFPSEEVMASCTCYSNETVACPNITSLDLSSLARLDIHDARSEVSGNNCTRFIKFHAEGEIFERRSLDLKLVCQHGDRVLQSALVHFQPVAYGQKCELDVQCQGKDQNIICKENACKCKDNYHPMSSTDMICTSDSTVLPSELRCDGLYDFHREDSVFKQKASSSSSTPILKGLEVTARCENSDLKEVRVKYGYYFDARSVGNFTWTCTTYGNGHKNFTVMELTVYKPPEGRDVDSRTTCTYDGGECPLVLDSDMMSRFLIGMPQLCDYDDELAVSSTSSLSHASVVHEIFFTILFIYFFHFFFLQNVFITETRNGRNLEHL